MADSEVLITPAGSPGSWFLSISRLDEVDDWMFLKAIFRGAYHDLVIVCINPTTQTSEHPQGVVTVETKRLED